MPGRPVDPDTNSKVKLHICRGYRYAATQPTTIDSSGNKIRRYVYWGEVTEDLVFVPNVRFKTEPIESRRRLIFPDDWDISEALCLNKNADSGQAGSDSPAHASGQFKNRQYGAVWLLERLAEQCHIKDDLMDVFQYDETIVNDVLTLSFFPMLTRWNYSQTSRWQRYTKTPSDHFLSPSYITRLTQRITNEHRMEFLHSRIIREKPNALLACDSTTRSGYGHCLADIRWGKNKDNEAMMNTLEVVAYSITSHEPIYYRTFAGNENDKRTVRAIMSDLKELGIENLTIIFDRGYESEDNFKEMIDDDQPFLMCAIVSREPIYSAIQKITYNNRGIPENMKYDKDNHCYYVQFDQEYKTEIKEGNLKINLYMDIEQRAKELSILDEAIHDEEAKIEKKISSGKSFDVEQYNKTLQYHRINKDMSYSQKEKTITKEENIAGFFSSIQYLLESDAKQSMEYYGLRDEQEKYFEEMKDQLGFNMQRNWSEDGKTGRLFILFIGLILRNKIRSVWKEKLKSQGFSSSIDVLHEMVPIRMNEYPSGNVLITDFTTSQMTICEAFGIEPPKECLSSYQKEEHERRKAGRKRGRPKGSINKKKKS